MPKTDAKATAILLLLFCTLSCAPKRAYVVTPDISLGPPIEYSIPDGARRVDSGCMCGCHMGVCDCGGSK